LVDAGLYRGDIYARVLIYKTGLKLSKIAKLLDILEVDEWDVIAMDDSQAKEQADLLRDEYGYFVKSANRRAGSILSGIGILQDYFIYIVDTSDGDWEKEQENYKWLERLGETVAKPVDDFNHLWDALRYWALEMLTTVEVEEFEGHSFSV
jgi:phage terminase large subunit